VPEEQMQSGASAEDAIPMDLAQLDILLQELQDELRGAFQDAHNAGFYINEYTTKVNALGDKLLEGLQRIVRKITAQERLKTAEGKEPTNTRTRNRERTHSMLKKLVFLMNSMQVKSGSELVFPILFDHMSFSTHRCWETNIRVPYAKILTAWQHQYKGSLHSLHHIATVAVRVGYILPAASSGKAQTLSSGWLMIPRNFQGTESNNEASMRQYVEKEMDDDMNYVYISPAGLRFASLNQALKHDNESGIRNRLDKEVARNKLEDLDTNRSMTIEFTSNHEDFMHRDMDNVFKDLPLYFYNMWVYGAKKPSTADPLAPYLLQVPFHASYGGGHQLRVQRLSIVPRVPQLEGIFIPSPEVNPHILSLIKLILFKPMHVSDDVDDRGNPVDPYKLVFRLASDSNKKRKRLVDENPYEVFPAAWNVYWEDTVLPLARSADAKLAQRKEWPTLWECKEIFLVMKSRALAKDLILSDAKFQEQFGYDPTVKLANRLTVQEYVCYMTRRVVKHLNAHGRAKTAPKTKSYAMDADAVEDPGIVRTAEGDANTDAAFEDMLDPDLDGEVRLKVGDAPVKVYHTLSDAARTKALVYQRQRITKFVRDMIDAGLLKLTANETSLSDMIDAGQLKLAARSSNDAAADSSHDETHRADQLRLKARLPSINQSLLDAQRESLAADPKAGNNNPDNASGQRCADKPGDDVSAREEPSAYWQTCTKPSAAMDCKIEDFEKSATGFVLSLEQRAVCRWFGVAMDATLKDEEQQVPLQNREQRTCLLIGAGGTGKTTVILALMLSVFCHFFPTAQDEDRYLITTFSHAQSDAISNETYRARTAHTACSYRVASLRNRDLALKTKQAEMTKRWVPKLLLIQDEISLVPAMVENMMLYRSMRARQDQGLDPAKYAQKNNLFGCTPIVLIAGDFMQMRPAMDVSLADDLDALARNGKKKVCPEHYAAQEAIMSIETVVHLKKTNRFKDAHLPAITTAMRASRPAAPMADDLLEKLRSRKIECCKADLEKNLFKHGHVVGMYWENIARSMVERAHRDARELNVPLFCMQAADQRHKKKSAAADAQLTHQLLSVYNLHKTGKLQGMLVLHESMVVRLTDVLAPKHGLVKEKLAVVLKIDLHQIDQERFNNLPAGFRQFFPEYMAKGVWVKLLKYNASPMKQHLMQEWHNQGHAGDEDGDDAGSVLFIELMHANFKIDMDVAGHTEQIEVIRWQFPLTHGMLRTAFAAQGLTLEGGVVVDLRRAGGLEDDDWWLAIYVMLSRARKLENLVLLGFTDQVESLLKRGPPANLIRVTEQLEAKAKVTLDKLMLETPQ
jgi:hypothetical protein